LCQKNFGSDSLYDKIEVPIADGKDVTVRKLNDASVFAKSVGLF